MTSAPIGSTSGERTGSEEPAPWTRGQGDSPQGGASAVREWRLPCTESSVTVLRRRLNAFLQGTSLSSEQLYDMLLAACEAASNAVEHAQHPSEPFFRVLIEVHGERVCIFVRDYGQWREGLAGPHRGRGLAMMRALADVSLVSQPGGTTVTLRSRGVSLRPPGS